MNDHPQQQQRDSRSFDDGGDRFGRDDPRGFDDRRGYDDRDFPRRLAHDGERFPDDGGYEGSFERSFHPSYNPYDRDDPRMMGGVRPGPQQRAWRDSASQRMQGRDREEGAAGWSPYDPDYNLRGNDRGRFEHRGDAWNRDRGYGTSPAMPSMRARLQPGEQIGTRRMPGKGVKGYKRSDERIREDVCDRISDLDVDASDVEVSVKDGEVTLSGTIPERQMKYAIEQCCDRVSGVTDCNNQLRMKRDPQPSSSTAADKATTSKQ